MVSDNKDNPYRRDYSTKVDEPEISMREADKPIEGGFFNYDGKIPPVGRRYSRYDTSKAFWVVTGVVLVSLSVGIALYLESTSTVKEENDPKSSNSAPANPNYSSPAPTPHEAYLKDGTSYKFYIIDNNVAVTELGGKPVIDSLEGKLGK